ncbi:helix-turn-helix transcriptional regulator [Anaeromyxobacter oryzae]|uniref:HTH luxR-type domain-containing protein n=1 Tax=Anaeromyxobacter oryzae TaxID=2918170 RepID=A0ABM7WS02_9BACT|nr:helix-turn-helix transcriptional regulator [Anaeromyxobacter oryzae]BDG02267.1 hypothetical protein AMOR_12630 [Anaeromyxobacter oryzae]
MAVIAPLPLQPSPSRAVPFEAPAGLRAGSVRLGTDELLVLDRPAPPGGAPAVTRACGDRLDALRAIHACYAPEPTDAAWLAGVVRALEPLAPSARWFARLDRLDGGDDEAGSPGAAAARDDAAAAILEAVGRECYRDLVRPHPPVQLLSHRLRSLPAAVERRVAGILSARGVPDALLLFGGELDGCAIALGMVVAPGIRAPSRTVGVLRHVAAHLNTARRLRERLGAARGGPPEDGPGARSLAEAAVARLERDGALAWCDAAAAARRWAALGDGAYALLDHWRTGGRLRLLARRCEDAGDPAALRRMELEVVAQAVRGAANDAIGARLDIAEATVVLHLASARARLRCGSRRELVALLGAAAEPGARATAA